jgi:hypothetical protein
MYFVFVFFFHLRIFIIGKEVKEQHVQALDSLQIFPSVFAKSDHTCNKRIRGGF